MASATPLIEVFNAVKLQPAGLERDDCLAEACGDDADLKAQVLSLLKAHEEAGSFMQAQPAPTPMLDTELLRIKPEKAGAHIGPYTLLEQIGEGGFGTVWVAEQHLPVRRTVALKIIKLGMDTKDVVARFEQERQALAVMDHPNIAKVLDAGATEEGRPFFVMELVHGIRITDYCDQANLPTVERLRLFIDVCHAVQHAHQKGIIHRDLKPSNILVALQDGVPVPKVIDFGVAKATQGPLTELTIYTRALEMVGTPLYMSPEQAEMNGLDVDTRTDIYALGVLLCELLTGRTPFDADTLRKAGYDEVRRIIREQEPQKPSTALHTMARGTLSSVAQHRASEPPKLIHAIRGDLDWIVMKTLEKDRARRYETANGLAADIQRHLQHEPVSARPPSRAYKFHKLVRRNKLAFFSAAAITAALVIGFATATRLYLRESEARKRATLAETLAKERLAEAEAVSTFMSEVFQSPDPARDGRTITVAETLDRAAKKLETDLADQPARRARLRATLGETYLALGLPRSAIPLHKEALVYYRAAFGPEHPVTISAMHSLARSYFVAGQWEDALKLREEVVALRRKVNGPERPETLWAMHHLAMSYFSCGRNDEALKLREEVLALHRKVLGPEHPETLWAMQNLANSYADVGRRDEPLKLCEEVVAIRRKRFAPEHPSMIAAMHSLGVAYSANGRDDEALKVREEVLTLRRKVLGPEHPDTLRAMHNLAESYAVTGHKDEALALREETLTLRRKALGPENPETLWAMHNLADSYAVTGQKDEALALREETLTLRRKVLGPKHPATLSTMQNLADSYLQAGRTEEALSLLVGASLRKPEDTLLATKVATLQVWFAKEVEYAATCRRMLQWAADATKPDDAERVAKITCLRPIDDASMQQATLALARRAVDLGDGNTDLSLWRQMTLGMAEYRSGHYPAADQALTTVATSKSVKGYRPSIVEGITSFYRAMSLYRQGKQAEARELFTAAEAKMPPLPADDKNPLADGVSDHDDLILWLACKEACELLSMPPAGER